MDFLDRIVAILFSLSILGLGVLVRRLTGSWATPAALFSGFWFLFSFIPLLALYFVPINPLAVGYIFLCCLAFALPALASNWHTEMKRSAAVSAARRGYLASPIIRGAFLVSFLMSTLFITLDLLVQGISLEGMIFDFYVSSHSYLEMRYEGRITSNVFGQWGLITAYLCVTFGGLVHAQTTSTRSRLFVLLLAMGPAMLVMLVQSAKGLFFLAIAILLGAHLVHRVLVDKRPYVDLLALTRQMKYLLIAVPLVLVSFLTRGLYNEDFDVVQDRLLGYLGSYAFLHLYAFSDWFSFTVGQPSLQSYDSEPLAYGFYTFIALFRLLGSTKVVPPGTYSEYFVVGDLSPGNIYTIFRGLVIDFGLEGTLLVLCVMGAIFNFAYRRMLTSQYPAASVAVSLLFFNFLYSSYLISTLMYNATYLVLVLYLLVFVANKYYAIAKERARSPLYLENGALRPRKA